MTTYFLFNTTQLKWADTLCRMSLMVHISSAISNSMNIVAFGDDGDDEYERMSEHRQRDCHQLRGMQHNAATDEDTKTEPCRSTDDTRTTQRDQNSV